MYGAPDDATCFEEFLAWRWRMLRAMTDDSHERERRHLIEENERMKEQIGKKAMAATK